jgi:hypothetical protein
MIKLTNSITIDTIMLLIILGKIMSAKRLLVSLDQETLSEIIELARYNNTSSSKIASQLIATSLELEEDRLFSNIADKRIQSTTKWVNHEDAWK